MLLLLYYTARGAVSENKFPKGPIEKAHVIGVLLFGYRWRNLDCVHILFSGARTSLFRKMHVIFILLSDSWKSMKKILSLIF